MVAYRDGLAVHNNLPAVLLCPSVLAASERIQFPSRTFDCRVVMLEKGVIDKPYGQSGLANTAGYGGERKNER